MARQISEHAALKYVKIKQSLIGDGWKSPDTYDSYFAPIKQISAVYLFLLLDSDTYDNAIVAYVGMTTQLKTRMSGHEMIGALDIKGYWPMRWFKPIAGDDLRDTESHYIKKYDPPWNISGKSRGLVLS